MFSKQRVRGFSLVELMVVISIIVILISFILPTVNGVNETVQTVQCASKLKQIHQAMVAWAWEHDKKFPRSRQGGWDSWVGWGWDRGLNMIRPPTRNLWSYMNEESEAYWCPTFLPIARSIKRNPEFMPAFSYSMNEYVGNGWHGRPPLNYVESIPNPDGLHLVGDENPYKVPGISKYTINNGAQGVGKWGSSGGWSYIVDSLGSFHKPPGGDINNGFSNVAFVDGHVTLVHVSLSIKTCTPKRWQIGPLIWQAP